MARVSGAMNVYSIVPSQRSHATVSISSSKMMPRYDHMTAPINRIVVRRSRSIEPPSATTPFAMKTIVSVFAAVQKKNATSHQA